MKKILSLIVVLFILTGCQKDRQVTEYVLFKSNNDDNIQRAYQLSKNQWISDDTITKLRENSKVQIDDAYMFPLTYYFSENDLQNDIIEIPIEWKLKRNGYEIRNRDTGLGRSEANPNFVIPYQYYAIAPFKDIEKLDSKCLKRFIGELGDYIPLYLPETELLDKMGIDDLDNNFTEEILLTLPVRMPISVKNGIYEMKRIDLTFQIVGIYKTTGSPYYYIPLEDMNFLINEYKQGELEPMSYIITTNNEQAEKIKKMEESLELFPLWNDDPKNQQLNGILDEGE